MFSYFFVFTVFSVRTPHLFRKIPVSSFPVSQHLSQLIENLRFLVRKVMPLLGVTFKVEKKFISTLEVIAQEM